MKTCDARFLRRRVAALIGIDILEGRPLLSVAGAAGDAVNVDPSQAVAVSSPAATGDAVSLDAQEPSSTPTGDGSQSSPAQPAASAPAASVAAPSGGGTGQAASAPAARAAPSDGDTGQAATASVASAAPSEGDTSQKDTGEAITHTLVVPVQPGSMGTVADVPSVGPLSSSDLTSGAQGPTPSAADPPAAQLSGGSPAVAGVTGGDLSSSSNQPPGSQADGDQEPNPSAEDPPAVQRPADLGWTIDAGADPSADTEEATSVADGMSSAASVPLRAGPLVTVGVVTTPTGNGLAPLEPDPDDTQPTADAVPTVRIVAARGLVRKGADLDVTMRGRRMGDEGEIREARAGEAAPLSLRCADLLTEFLPFDRATLEAAIDDFLAPLEALGSGWGSWSPSSSLFPEAAIVVTAALAAEVVRRRARSGQRTIEEGDEDLARFPGYASAWGLGES